MHNINKEQQTDALTAILAAASNTDSTISANIHNLTPQQLHAAKTLQADVQQAVKRYINLLHS